MRAKVWLAFAALATLVPTQAVGQAMRPTVGQGGVAITRFSAPVTASQAEQLAREEAQALSAARRAVADMRQLARTPQERALAVEDGRMVEAIAGLVGERGRLRRMIASLRTPSGSTPTPTPANPRGSTGASPHIGAAADGSGQDRLLAATRAMEETQMNFSLQYLRLQSQMQHENRSYTAISNIMKTKHDTVKNSISNIR